MNKIVIACFLAAALLLALALAIALLSEETNGSLWQPVNQDLERLVAEQSKKADQPNGTGQSDEAEQREQQPDPTGAKDGSDRSAGSSGAAEQAGNSELPVVDLNSATLEELDSLPGIGPVKAQAIIDYRIASGGFYSIEELMEVKGIGPKTFERLKERITVTKPSRPPP